MQVQDANLAGVNDAPDGIERRPVISLLVLSVLHELPAEDIGLELRPRYEVVVLTVHLGFLPRSGSI